MKKKNNKKREERKIKIKRHIKHKTKLTSLFALKIIIAFGLSVIVFRTFFSFFTNFLGIIIAGILSFLIASVVYLFLIIKVLKIMKF